MIACVDVDYRDQEAMAACVVFRAWGDEQIIGEHVTHIAPIADYEPGQFYRRELPCLLAVLGRVSDPLQAIIVDGYVWLGKDHPGLGAHLHQALGECLPVIGVAKTAFQGSPHAEAVRRPGSRRPLFVTSVGMDQREAARLIAEMAGSYRIPDLLRRVDQLCRTAGAVP